VSGRDRIGNRGGDAVIGPALGVRERINDLVGPTMDGVQIVAPACRELRIVGDFVQRLNAWRGTSELATAVVINDRWASFYEISRIGSFGLVQGVYGVPRQPATL